MIQFELSQLIEQPKEKMFEFLKDFRNMTLWNYYVMEVQQVSEGDIKVDSLFLMKRKHDMHHYKLVEITPENSITVVLQPPSPNQQMHFILEDRNESTFVTYQWKVNLGNYKLLKYIPDFFLNRWLLGFAERHILNVIKPAVEQNFGKLKILVETGEVVLQDGRIIKWNTD